jgi:hypothetical protein
MKKFTINSETIVLGNAAEIKRLYKTLVKRCRRNKGDIYPLFLDEPGFNEDREYAIYIQEDRYFRVVSALHALQWLDDIGFYFGYSE